MDNKIINRLVEILESNSNLTWQNFCKFNKGMPINLVSKNEYKGFNRFFLSHISESNPMFITFKQANDLGLEIKKEELRKYYPVNFFCNMTKEKENGENKDVRFFKLFFVYSINQIVDCDKKEKFIADYNSKYEVVEFSPAPITEREKNCHDKLMSFCEKNFISVEITDCKTGSYSPALNRIRMPEMKYFKTFSHWLDVFSHEVIHATSVNLKRCISGNFGSTDYSKEELIAEIGSALIMNQFELETQEIEVNTASYLKSWLGAIKQKPSFLYSSFSQAQKATELVLN